MSKNIQAHAQIKMHALAKLMPMMHNSQCMHTTQDANTSADDAHLSLTSQTMQLHYPPCNACTSEIDVYDSPMWLTRTFTYNVRPLLTMHAPAWLMPRTAQDYS
eukprot:scaffold12896_cov22-Tisochrysis_lutea.AAC.1